jgi:hypothetical protein
MAFYRSLSAAVPGRRLDDDGAPMFHLARGGRGTLVASQICSGEANGLEISVWCEDAGLHWRQEQPDKLPLARRGRPEEIWSAGSDQMYLDPSALSFTRKADRAFDDFAGAAPDAARNHRFLGLDAPDNDAGSGLAWGSSDVTS